MRKNSYTLRPLMAMLALTLFTAVAAASDGRQTLVPPYPEFTADYDVRINGFEVARSTFSLQRLDNGQYLYRQKTRPSGLGSMFSSERSETSSRWRFTEKGIEVLEYITRREDGKEDENVHLRFDWAALEVSNSNDPRWRIKMPEGTLDQMVMQLAMLLELKEGARKFSFNVVRGNASIKRYLFEVVGTERLKFNDTAYDTIELMRTNDSKDLSRIWSAPDLNYFPVRFLKEKKSGINIEMIMRDVHFKSRPPVRPSAG